jgi:hypothetical protein
MLAKPFKPSPIFVSKVRRIGQLIVSGKNRERIHNSSFSSLLTKTLKQLVFESLVRDKRSSLLDLFVSNEENSFVNITEAQA